MNVKMAKGKDTVPKNINSSNKNGRGGNIFVRAIYSILNAFVYIIRKITTLIGYVPIRVAKLLFKIWIWYTLERARAAAKNAMKIAGFWKEEESSVSSEILKSIVYGGLKTIITSLCIVACLAAFDAPVEKVVDFAPACIIGGIFLFVYNIWEFKRICNNKTSSKKEKEKYKEQLGRENYFPMHAGFATLSFIVFGMIPPVLLLFLETGYSNDLSMALVEVVSLLCVAMLAIFKVSAISYKDYFQHIINLAYYLARGVSFSICSYLAGYVAKKLVFKFYY